MLPLLLGRLLPDGAAAPAKPSAAAGSAEVGHVQQQEQVAACLALLDSLLAGKPSAKRKAPKGSVSEAVLADCGAGIQSQVRDPDDASGPTKQLVPPNECQPQQSYPELHLHCSS